jgi:hypothetical protein
MVKLSCDYCCNDSDSVWLAWIETIEGMEVRMTISGLEYIRRQYFIKKGKISTSGCIAVILAIILIIVTTIYFLN